ncbi:hypothetical protein VCHA38P217_10184 [Vibrio chagasii]|nr:hypothetical protein VCHA34P120_190092 [Vibrio chagasii]CAH6880054.1 hypothetical protein VCHA36O157_20184 [Vibrio chagasii]CAH6915633.1 hypothetical protein VCHA34P115_30265 [Vibrio chagasii]CAH7083683.1 hypothetical protein VCHA41O246_10433 [Vibrio chagasii]CAH7121949.1 hypothetical protein VCHA37P192_100184 [Vibrio chagasii]
MYQKCESYLFLQKAILLKFLFYMALGVIVCDLSNLSIWITKYMVNLHQLIFF